jgi:hypothetical protein
MAEDVWIPAAGVLAAPVIAPALRFLAQSGRNHARFGRSLHAGGFRPKRDSRYIARGCAPDEAFD